MRGLSADAELGDVRSIRLVMVLAGRAQYEKHAAPLRALTDSETITSNQNLESRK